MEIIPIAKLLYLKNNQVQEIIVDPIFLYHISFLYRPAFLISHTF